MSCSVTGWVPSDIHSSQNSGNIHSVTSHTWRCKFSNFLLIRRITLKNGCLEARDIGGLAKLWSQQVRESLKEYWHWKWRAQVTVGVVWFKLPDGCHQGHGRDLLKHAPCCVDLHTHSCSQTRCLLPSGYPTRQCLSLPSVTHDFHLAINTFETPCKKFTM